MPFYPCNHTFPFDVLCMQMAVHSPTLISQTEACPSSIQGGKKRECKNCHMSHGWRDLSTPPIHFPSLTINGSYSPFHFKFSSNQPGKQIQRSNGGALIRAGHAPPSRVDILVHDSPVHARCRPVRLPCTTGAIVQQNRQVSAGTSSDQGCLLKA